MKHCCDVHDDLSFPECVRKYFSYNCGPMGPAASRRYAMMKGIPRPSLYAEYNGKRVRVVMASRFGDVGVTEDLNRISGYDTRIHIDDLSNFGENP